jgi:GNAT superfamily N-acetyltransferase
MEGYTFERLCEKHFADLGEISFSAFGVRLPVSYFREKNNTSQFGEPNLGFIAYSADGEPAAFYGVYACQAELEGKVYAVAQSGDTMTHKNHTGKGLFTALAKATYALCREHNVNFVYGFPNYNSYPGFVKKLDWICPGTLKEYRVKVPTIPFLKLAKKIPFLSGAYNFYSSLILSYFKPTKTFFRSSAIEPGIGGLLRSEEFVKYKLKNGSRLVCVGGVNSWIRLDGFLILGDADLNSPGFEFNKFIKNIKKMSFFLGADVVQFLTTPNTKLDKMFAEEYSFKDSIPFGFCNFNKELDIEKFRFVFADSDTF